MSEIAWLSHVISVHLKDLFDCKSPHVYVECSCVTYRKPFKTAMTEILSESTSFILVLVIQIQFLVAPVR